MVDEHTDYRPARSRDFTRAIHNVDASDLRSTPPPPVSEDAARGYATGYPPSDVRPDGTALERAPVAGVAADRDRRYVDRPEGTMNVDRPDGTTIEERRTGPVDARPFSIAAGFFGWAVASFFTLVLSTLVLALLGAAAYDATNAGATGVTQETFNSLTTTGLVGLFVALLAAYFLGGYAAGRIGLWHGVGHGVAVVGWTLLFTVLTIALAAWLGDAVAGLNLVPAIDWGDLTGPAIAGILVSLLAMLAGAILGAKLGTRPYGIDGVNEGLAVRGYRRRGRPL